MVGSDDERNTRTADQTRRRRRSRLFLAAGAVVALTAAGSLTWEYGQVPERIAEFRGENCGIEFSSMTGETIAGSSWASGGIVDLRDEFDPFEATDFSDAQRRDEGDVNSRGYLRPYDDPEELEQELLEFGEAIGAEPEAVFIDRMPFDDPGPAIHTAHPSSYLLSAERSDGTEGNVLLGSDPLASGPTWRSLDQQTPQGDRATFPIQREFAFGDQRRWELVTYDLSTGEQLACQPVTGDSHRHDLDAGVRPPSTDFLEPVDDSLVLANTPHEDDEPDGSHLTLYSAEDEEIIWQVDNPRPSPIDRTTHREVVGEDVAILNSYPVREQPLAIYDFLHDMATGDADPTRYQSVAIDLEDGSEAWEYPESADGEPAMGLPISEVTLDEENDEHAALMGRAEAVSAEEYEGDECPSDDYEPLCAVSWTLELLTPDGEVLWSYDLGERNQLRGNIADFGVVDDVIVHQVWDEHDGVTFQGISLQDGELLWDHVMDREFYLGSFIDVGDEVLLSADLPSSPPFWSLDPETGELEEQEAPFGSELSWVTDDYILLNLFHRSRDGGSVYVLYER